MRNVNPQHQPPLESELQTESKEMLRSKKEYPSVSLLLPVNPQYPKVREEEKKLKAMIKKVEEKLESQVPAKIFSSLAAKFRKTLTTIDFSHLSRSLAVFVSQDKQKVIHLPFQVEEKTIIANSFELRDLLYAAKHSYHYAALSLSENKARLFWGYNHHLSEESLEELPLGITDTGGKGYSRSHKFNSISPGRNVPDQFAYREVQMEKYLHDLDKILSKQLGKKNIPLVLLGERKITDQFKAISKSTDKIIGKVDGNYDKASHHEILQRIEPSLEEKTTVMEKNAMALLDDAVSRRMSASGIAEVWKAVMEKRGRLLLVEKDYNCPAKLGGNKFTLIVNNVKENGIHIIPDAVDDIIEYVLLFGGDVIFVNNGTLPDHQRIALITYYA